jgi:hypothetical protein
MPRVIGILTRADGRDWQAEFPDLPGCSVRAASIPKLRDAARPRLLEELRARRARGEPPPELSDWEKIARHPLAQGAMVIGVDLA